MSSSRGPGRPPGAPAPRRRQLIDVTIDLIAEQGFGAATLGRVAGAAGLSKSSVLHHVSTVAELIDAAYEHVLDDMVSVIGPPLDAAHPADRPGVYVREMIGYFLDHPRHTRMVSEALVHLGVPAETRERWGPLAELLREAREARGIEAASDLRTAAVAIGGAIDAIVREHLTDPGYDSAAAAEQLATALEATVLSSPQ